MASLDPAITIVLVELVRGLRALNVEFCVIGALVPELLLSVKPRRLTKDADVTVILGSLDDFERLKERLSDFGFARTRWPYRLTHERGGWVDLLPYSPALVQDGYLHLSRDLSFNMAGFGQVVPNAIQAEVSEVLHLPVVPLPLYALLKLLAFHDRREPKDLSSVLHCLRHYAEEDDRRYGLEHRDEIVLFEHTGAYLLGLDGRRYHETSLVTSVRAVLDQLDSFEAPLWRESPAKKERFSWTMMMRSSERSSISSAGFATARDSSRLTN